VKTADGFWAGKTVFVTGGASFIGSTLTDQLLARGAKKVRIVDDLSSGHLDNIRQHLGTGKVDFLQADLPRIFSSTVWCLRKRSKPK
jgi:nucleoside-diphosphate-sugar epimerase